jgi:hypothetical protein
MALSKLCITHACITTVFSAFTSRYSTSGARLMADSLASGHRISTEAAYIESFERCSSISSLLHERIPRFLSIHDLVFELMFCLSIYDLPQHHLPEHHDSALSIHDIRHTAPTHRHHSIFLSFGELCCRLFVCRIPRADYYGILPTRFGNTLLDSVNIGTSNNVQRLAFSGVFCARFLRISHQARVMTGYDNNDERSHDSTIRMGHIHCIA